MIVLKVITTLVYILSEICANENNKTQSENTIKYGGEKFPENYLYAEDIVPTKIDLYKYMTALDSVFTYFNTEANDTCNNRAIGTFFAKETLIRTLQDDGGKLQKPQLEMLKSLLHKADFYLSHFQYMYIQGNTGPRDEHSQALKKFAYIVQGADILGFSLPDFSKNLLKKWILIDHNINTFLEAMDSAVLPKEMYVELLAVSAIDYHITIEESDRCIINLYNNILPPTKNKKLTRCEKDFRCKKAIHSEPSIGYGLSHRMLNLMLYRYQRHCYWRNPESDLVHIHVLCAFMYREAVYIARRGFFARDMFIEHVALCGLMGYEEFYRRNWFSHVIRWIDNNGCITENRNFLHNRTHFECLFATDKKTKSHIKTRYKAALRTNCEDHPMAVLTPYLANAIRHAAHFMTSEK